MTALDSDLIASLDPLFRPSATAVIGASRTAGKQGNTAIRYLQQCGYGGRIFPVNPSGGDVEGITCYRSISDVPEQVDCALLVIPAGAVPAAIEECAASGVRSAIIGSNGFAEMGSDEGRARQARLVEIVQKTGIRLLGPNTNGIWNATDHFSLGYNTSHGDQMVDGGVSIVAHSGALFNSIAPRLVDIGSGLSKFVPVGNEADLDMLDILEYLIADPATRVIGLIVEGLSDGARFGKLAAAAIAAKKPIVALKLGRSAAGAGAALAHSSRLAGSARAYEALFREYGVPTVPTIEGLAASCALLALSELDPMDGDSSLICVSSSGGGGSLLADTASTYDIPMAGSPAGDWEGGVAELIAGFEDAGLIRNPIDGGNLYGWPRLEAIFAAMEQDGLNGPIAAYGHMLPSIKTDENLITPLIERKRRTGSPVVMIAPGGLRLETKARLTENQIPVFADMETAFHGLKSYYTMLGVRAAPAAKADAAGAADDGGIAEMLTLECLPEVLSEADSAAILRQAGVPMVENRSVQTIDEAAAAAAALGYPVVLKALVPGIAHKNNAGLVHTGISDEEELRQTYETLEQRALALKPSSDHQTILVQPMIASEVELILGVSYEPPLGHFLVAGLGGIHAEVFDKILLLPVPVAVETAERRVSEGEIGRVLSTIGSEKQVSSAIGDIAAALMALQNLVLAAPKTIESVDVNPLLITKAGCIAVDALVIRQPLD
jgi:acyl-CoA synthetase (NDP forming)